MGSYGFCWLPGLSKHLLLQGRQSHCYSLSFLKLKIHTCHDSAKKPKSNDIQELLDKYEDIKLIPHMITHCEFGKSFSKTTVEHHRYTVKIQEADKNKSVQPFVPFKSVYQGAFNYLDTYASGKVDHNLLDIRQISAFVPLYKFLTDIEYHERCLRRDGKDIFDGKPEGYVAVLLTNHLLSNLVPGNEYIISNDYDKDKRPLFCPCFDTINCGKKMSQRYGQTGMGYEKLWYGRPDILFITDREYNSCVMVAEEDCFNEENNVDDDHDEEELDEDFCEITKIPVESWSSQAIAQCITFSFFQANVKRVIALNDGSLIPTLVLTPNKFFIYMYDYNNDVLLTSAPAPLWDQKGQQFRKSAVLQIWMVLNHLNFVPKLSVNQVKYLEKSGNFHKLISCQVPLSELPKKISFKSSFLFGRKEKNMGTNMYPEYLLE